MAELVWWVKLVAELEPGVTTETELARIERDAQASVAELGLRLDEAKQLTAALQAEMVPAQVAALGRSRRACEAFGRVLVSKGHYGATFRSLFGDVPVRVRRRLACLCQGAAGVKSCNVLDLGKDALAPELAYVTARYAALMPFGKVAALLSELLPISGAQHASTVRNRTLRVGMEIVQAHAAETMDQPAVQATGPAVVGLDGGYVRSRATAMPGYGGYSVRFCRMPRSFLTGGMPRCASSTRYRRPVASPGIRRPTTRISRTRRCAAWSGRSGACGTGAGPGAGARSPPCAAGCSAGPCATSPAWTKRASV